jgi:GH25 family lysozyme M1 (1,4-beta-N-acetylmuramidase)
MTFKNVIDVSACQGIIDWNRINVDAVIIRAGFGREISQKD